MLSKLIKHEFRATSRIMWPVFLGMLALTALMRFSQLLLNGGHIPWLLQLIGVLLVIGFVMGLFALAFAPLVLSAVRWRDHVLKDEGYLTLTLPVSLHQLLISKLIVSAVWYAAAFIVGLLSLLIAASGWSTFQYVPDFSFNEKDFGPVESDNQIADHTAGYCGVYLYKREGKEGAREIARQGGFGPSVLYLGYHLLAGFSDGLCSSRDFGYHHGCLYTGIEL